MICIPRLYKEDIQELAREFCKYLIDIHDCDNNKIKEDMKILNAKIVKVAEYHGRDPLEHMGAVRDVVREAEAILYATSVTLTTYSKALF